jgi:DNA (cytosine-5)-methyltransferase 1
MYEHELANSVEELYEGAERTPSTTEPNMTKPKELDLSQPCETVDGIACELIAAPRAYYNEIDAFASQWLANLYPHGLIDSRSIKDVNSTDLSGFQRVHLFAGIGGWEYALQLAGWPADREVWTGSCPCQPFSAAGKRKGTSDERHLWPEMFRLIRECRPATIFGEQVPAAIGHGWLDEVFGDLEGEGYACGAAVLPASCLGAPHERKRIWWVGDAGPSSSRHDGTRQGVEARFGEARQPIDCAAGEPRRRSGDCSMAHAHRPELPRIAPTGQQPIDKQDGGTCIVEHAASNGRDARRAESVGRGIASGCGISTVADAHDERWGELRRGAEPEQANADIIISPEREEWLDCWSDAILISCSDGKQRPISPERGDGPLAHGIPRDLGRAKPELAGMAKGARSNRVGRLRGYGNAIVPQVAAVFIRAFLEHEAC